MQQGLGWHLTSHKPGFDKLYQPSLDFGHRGNFQVKLVLFQVKSVLFNSNWACNTAEIRNRAHPLHLHLRRIDHLQLWNAELLLPSARYHLALSRSGLALLLPKGESAQFLPRG